MIKRLWAGVAGVALLGAVGATAIVVAGTGGEEEVAPAVQQTATSLASPTSAVSPLPTPAVTATAAPAGAAETTAPAPTTPVGGKAPDGCVNGEAVYQDPATRFAFCYPADILIRTSEYGGNTSVGVDWREGLDRLWIIVGWEQLPAYVPCQEAGEGLEARNRRFEELSFDGRSVSACFQDLYHSCIPGLRTPTVAQANLTPQ
jgi:hypothetical protein